MGRAPLSPYAAAVAICRRLSEAGHVAYLAGGCVRDRLLGVEPGDYDVATEARPQTVVAMFPGARYVGEAFGVVLVPMGGVATEVATFRVEWGYRDGRRPDRVEFTDAEHDARRRDFTINGLFEQPGGQDAGPHARSQSAPNVAWGKGQPLGRVIDFVGGVDDLRAGVVRAIGEADQRFSEDYLRMLRAVRFAARLGFDLDPATAAAIVPLAPYLKQISRERIGAEIQKMLTGPDPARAATLTQHLCLDGPALGEDHATCELPTLEALASGPSQAPASRPRVTPDPHLTYPLALSAWLLDRHAPPSTEPPSTASSSPAPALERLGHTDLSPILTRWHQALCLTNDHRDRLRRLLQRLPVAMGWDRLDKAGRKRLLADQAWPEVWALLRAVAPGRGQDKLVRCLETDAAELTAEGVAPPPLLSGADLIALGLHPGPAFKHLLEGVYDQQLLGLVTTREQALAWVRGTEIGVRDSGHGKTDGGSG